MCGTPGPGNLTMMAIGQSTGFRSALPFLAGALTGGFMLNCAVVLGLGQLITASAGINLGLKIVGFLYMLYLSVKVLRMPAVGPGAGGRFTFYEGLVLHPTSPKTWAMSLVALTQFSLPGADPVSRALLFVGCFVGGGLVFHSLWGLAGDGLLRLLRTPALRTAVNISMVVMMLGATVYALLA